MPMMPVPASCEVIRLRSSDRRTWLLYSPKLGSSPEARKTMSPSPTGPGPSSYPPPVQSPFSVCFAARYCRPRSYISRTSRGTTSPNFVAGIWARLGRRHKGRRKPSDEEPGTTVIAMVPRSIDHHDGYFPSRPHFYRAHLLLAAWLFDIRGSSEHLSTRQLAGGSSCGR